MSVFQVQLANANQGRLDVDMVTAKPVATSLQRSIFVTGPNHIYRELKDGQVFTDSNYWKQFAYPQCSLADAFINVVSDDGSVYSTVPSENTYLKTYTLSVAAGSTFSANVADILGDTGSYAVFTQITNMTGSKTVKVKVNGSATSIFDLPTGTQIYNVGELSVTKVEFDYSASGASGNVAVQVQVSVKSQNNS
jgi:hypothetical protein